MRTQAKIVSAYLLFLGVALFLWPVALGIPWMPLRLVWIVCALPLVFLSAWGLHRAWIHEHDLVLHLDDFPWVPFFIVLLALFYPLITLPLRTFSDETFLALPAVTFAYKLAMVVTWPGLIALSVASIGFAIVLISLLSWRWHMLLVAALAVFAGVVAFYVPHATTLAIRYPPVVHLVSGLGVIFTAGDLHWLRLPNIVWTVLAALAIWQLCPHWNRLRKQMLFLGLLLGPLGWMFHITLYQACGEMTLALVAVLLTSSIIRASSQERAGYLGIVLSIWMLYRPTSFVASLAIIGLLLLTERWKAAKYVVAIFLPVALVWIALYPAYSYEYLFQGHGLFPAAQSAASLLAPFQAFWESLSYVLHPAVLIVAVTLTAWNEYNGDDEQKVLLRTAWLVALSASLAQHVITTPILYGYTRFSNLLAVPVALSFAGLFRPPFTPTRRLLGGATTLLFLMVTPFNAIHFAQNILKAPDVLHTFTAGADVPLPFTELVLATLPEHPALILLAPDYSVLELAVASEILSPDQRTAIIKRSQEWKPGDADRPVIVQAPAVTYQPTITAAQEERLRTAHSWALNQKTHQVIRLGTEEAIVVP